MVESPKALILDALELTSQLYETDEVDKEYTLDKLYSTLMDALYSVELCEEEVEDEV